MFEKCYNARRGNIGIFLYILQRVAQGFMLSPTFFKVFFSVTIIAVEAAKQSVKVGEDTISGLMFAHGFVGIAETSEGFQKQIEKALEYTRKLRVTASNVHKIAILVCNEDKKDPVDFKLKLGEEELPIVDQNVYIL